MNNTEPVLSIANLSISFRQYRGVFRQGMLPVIQDLSLTVGAGEMVAVVGSSGSGKSLLAHGILGILPYNAAMEGRLQYCGDPLTPQRQRRLRGREITLVPQGVSYLDPLMRVGPQVRGGKRDTASKAKSRETLARYGLDAGVESLYPFQLSGGMARRVLISTAVMPSPRLIIADEPTPGLHLDAARRVLGHFRELAEEGAGVLLITHDLELALETADRVAVFYAGTTVEELPAARFAKEESLRHPYTRALWRAMPRNGFQALPGAQPYPGEQPQGCLFLPRCPHAGEDCQREIPYLPVGDGHVRCVRPLGEVRS